MYSISVYIHIIFCTCCIHSCHNPKFFPRATQKNNSQFESIFTHLVFKDLGTAALSVNDWPLWGKCALTVVSYHCQPQSHWSSISEADINGEDSALFTETGQFLFVCWGKRECPCKGAIDTNGPLIQCRLCSQLQHDCLTHLLSHKTDHKNKMNLLWRFFYYLHSHCIDFFQLSCEMPRFPPPWNGMRYSALQKY